MLASIWTNSKTPKFTFRAMFLMLGAINVGFTFVSACNGAVWCSFEKRSSLMTAVYPVWIWNCHICTLMTVFPIWSLWTPRSKYPSTFREEAPSVILTILPWMSYHHQKEQPSTTWWAAPGAARPPPWARPSRTADCQNSTHWSFWQQRWTCFCRLRTRRAQASWAPGRRAGRKDAVVVHEEN
jgi:hypothetical protein